MWVLDAPGGNPGKNSFFRDPLSESVPVGPRIGVFGACGSALLPETGAKHRSATPWVLYKGHVGTLQARWVSWENSFFKGRLWVQETGDGAVLTMVEQGYDPSVAQEQGQAQGCDPMGNIKGPCGYTE